MILIIDNYDSFTFNLVQFIGELGADPQVFRNDVLSIEEIRNHHPNGIIISPGPGRPEDAGISVELVQEVGGEFPILGVCLGHQVITVAHGGKVCRAPIPVHGKSVMLHHDNSTRLLAGVRSPFEAGRYHSLVAEAQSIPNSLEVTVATDDGLVMCVQHKKRSIFGVQFHPESILTEDGKILLNNFLQLSGEVKKSKT